MAHINLLPWREARRKEKQKEFIAIALFSAAIAGVLMFFVHVQVNGMIEYQQARNQFLQNEIKILDKRIQEIKDGDAVAAVSATPMAAARFAASPPFTPTGPK